MALKDKDDYIYSVCDHFHREKPDLVVNEQIVNEIASNFRTVPSLEESLYSYVWTRHYSLERNKLLGCRWKEYKKQSEDRVYAPFQFPDRRDLHFHNNAIRFLPSQTMHKRSLIENRKRLKPGPGVDNYGQMPIPSELLMKRGAIKKK